MFQSIRTLIIIALLAIGVPAVASNDLCIDRLEALHEKFDTLSNAERTEAGKLQVQRTFAGSLIDLSDNPLCVDHPLRKQLIVSQAQTLLDADARGRRTGFPKLNYRFYYSSGDFAKTTLSLKNKLFSTKECSAELQRLIGFEKQQKELSLGEKMTFARARLELFEGSCKADARAAAQITAAYEFLDSVGARTIGRTVGGIGTMASDQSSRKVSETAKLKLLRRYGNGCAKLNPTTFKISGDWAEAEFYLENSCNSTQLIEVLLSYDAPPMVRPQLLDVVGQTSRPLWPEAELPYPNLSFQPTNQLNSAVALTANGGAIIKMRQIAPGSEYQYKIASCDALANGKANVVFRDLSLDAGFVCVPYPR